MIDSRFFNKKDFLTIKEICELLTIQIPDNCQPVKKILDIARLDNSTSSDITFFHNAKYSKELENTKAFACVISKKHKDLVPEYTIPFVVNDPYLALAVLLKVFYSSKNISIGKTFVSKKASISNSAIVEDGCYISDFVTISEGCFIKKNTFIGENSTILSGVEIGENSHIESNVTIGFSIIGNNAYIKTGARLGQQGFGFHIGKTQITDIFQIGRVIVGNNTQIGANCTIDRGSLSDTKIGDSVRIDDMVHVAHNVEIGDFCIIAAQTGIAGSTKIGKACVFGGQVGISGHINIGDKVIVAAQSGIMRNAETDSKIAGSPAIGVMNWHRQNVLLQKLVENRNQNNKTNRFFSRFKLLFK